MSIDFTIVERRKEFAARMLQMRVDRAALAPYGTLKKLTQRCIIKNKKFFCKLNLQNENNPFLKISNSMKKELIEMQTQMQEEADADENYEQSELQSRLLKMMLNLEVTAVHFPPGLDSDSLAVVTQLWQTLLEVQPPEMHTIVCKGMEHRTNWDARPFFDNLLPAFPNLEVLQLATLECHDLDIENIVEHLPKLRVLEVAKLDNMSKEGILSLRKLTSLEEFLFGILYRYRSDPLEIQRMTQCFELLPHLHAVGMTKPVVKHFFYQTMRSVSFFTGFALTKIAAPCKLQLRYLALYQMEQLPVHVSMPELRFLYVHEAMYEMHPLFAGGLPKLSELFLMETDEDTLMLVLGHVGQQLQKMHFSVLDGMGQLWGNRVRLDRILDACPNLTYLDVSTSYSPSCESELRPDTLQHLRTLKIYFSYADDLQSGLLLQILRLAPELRSLDLSSVSLDTKDLRKLAQLAEEGTCMHHLEDVRMLVDRREFSKYRITLLNKAVISCSINCPKLQKFSVKYFGA